MDWQKHFKTVSQTSTATVQNVKSLTLSDWGSIASLIALGLTFVMMRGKSKR